MYSLKIFKIKYFVKSYSLHYFYFSIGFPSEEVDTNICLSEIFLELKPKESLNISNPGFEDSHYPANALCSWTITSSSHPDAVNFYLII